MNTATTVDDFVRNFENAVEGVEPNSLDADTDFRQLEQWDSLAALSVLAMVDAEYESEITGNELKRCNTLRDLFEIVQSKR